MLAHAWTTACRKREKGKEMQGESKAIVQETRVQLVPCLSYVECFYAVIIQGIHHMTFRSQVKWVWRLSNQTCHHQKPSLLLEDQILFYMSLMLQFVNDSVPLRYVFVYTVCVVLKFAYQALQFRRNAFFDWKPKCGLSLFLDVHVPNETFFCLFVFQVGSCNFDWILASSRTRGEFSKRPQTDHRMFIQSLLTDFNQQNPYECVKLIKCFFLSFWSVQPFIC